MTHTHTAASAQVLFRDAALLVLNKPSGLLVHRGWANDKVTALTVARGLAGQHVYPIHRLDRSASGVLVFGLSPEVARAAQEQLQAGRWEKEYLALVRGPTPERGHIDYPLAPEKGKPKKHAVTDYERIANFERYSLLRVWPRTGRLHQIRRHLRHLSHPLIGDVRYGKAEHNRLLASRFGVQRLCLHAVRLQLPHPTSGEALDVRAPLPDDLAGPFTSMGLDWLTANSERTDRD